ncbi:MAG: hypothetical protein H0U72_09110 [Nitrosospira sp.]|nr:hypothetical protein [Nitrosospira sp.]
MNEGTWESENDQPQDLGTSIIDSALDPYVFRKLGALVDVTFNMKTTLAILGEVPVLDKLTKAYGGVSSVHHDLFIKKIVGFLDGCGNMTEGEKTEFGERLENDADYRRKVGESLLLILDRLDNFDKTKILGKVFAARYKKEIDETTFFRLAAAICNASIADLENLESSYAKIATYDMKAGKPFSDSLDDATAQSLFSVGFVRADGYMEMTYVPNELGSTLICLMKQ